MRRDISEPIVGLFDVLLRTFIAVQIVIWTFMVIVGLVVACALGYLGYTAVQWIQADTARIEADR